MAEIELQVWRTLRVLTVLTVIVVLLLAAGSLSNSLDLALVGGSTSSASTSSATSAVRVQTYAEIVPGSGSARTALAWADGATMHSESVADGNELRAAAAAAWPEQTLGPEGAAPVSAALLTTTSPVSIAAGDTATTPTHTPMPVQSATGMEPLFLVTQPYVNVRGGPSTAHPILFTTGAGRRFSIIGRHGDWWQLALGVTPGWMHSALGETEGNTEDVPWVDEFAPAPTPTLISRPEGTSATPTPTADIALPPIGAVGESFAYPFTIETVARHREANTVVIYGYVHENGNAVDGRYLWITHNGAVWRSGPSSGLITGMTKPATPDDPENVAYNVKIDFPGFLYPTLESSGEWLIVLVDGSNQALSDVTRVTIAPSDLNREIYLRYRMTR